LADENLTYITSILASFSRPKSQSRQQNKLDCAIFTPEGTPTQAPAKQVTPPKFNQKFNQESMIENSEAENFICFSGKKDPLIWQTVRS